MTFEGELYYDKLKKFVLMDKDLKINYMNL